MGDECEGDGDGDGTLDHEDNCPNNSRVAVTDFNSFTKIALDPHGASQADPKWELRNKGAEIVQTLNSDPGLAIGQDKIEGVDFEGTFFVNTYSDDDYVGFVFSFQVKIGVFFTVPSLFAGQQQILRCHVEEEAANILGLLSFHSSSQGRNPTEAC